MLTKIAILGTGSWGSAVGEILSLKGYQIVMWQRDKIKAAAIEKTRNHPFLEEFTFSDNITFTADLEYAIEGADFTVTAVPSHGIRELMVKVKKFIKRDAIIVNLSKGLELDTLLTMSSVISQELLDMKPSVVSIYGPSHAEEVIRKIPTTLVAASLDLKAAEKVQTLFSSQFLRVYTNDDLIGVELGGSLKNVIAIAAGICDGIGFGDNTKAAILTRGIAEMTRLGVAMGAKEKTFAGLSGIGDLFVTCSSKFSRNRYIGEEIGKGKTLKAILGGMDMVAEGVKTVKAVIQLCEKHNIEMPISTAVYGILYQGKNPIDTVRELMTRDLISEH